MTAEKTTLHQLLDAGQSPWIDYITRDLLKSGGLKGRMDQGIVGMTSNPTIFQKAIADGASDYDQDLHSMVRDNKDVSDIYDGLVLDDIRNAATILRPVYDSSDGRDGYVSIEVSPDLSHDTERTLAEARRLFVYLNLPNIMVKVPGTAEGLPAIQHATAEGININVTLLFSVDNYRQVAEAYISGLEQRASAGQPIDHIASVASFFVSRVDTAVDKKLDALIDGAGDEARKGELGALKGKAAIANAKMAYVAFQEIFSGPRWEALASHGAKVQRPLWASTSTKNKAYRDVMYVEQLIGADTVDTMPPATIDDFMDHGAVAPTITQDVEAARTELGALERAGVSMDEVTRQLQEDGVRLFTESFNELIGTISSKREEMMSHAR